MKIKFLTFICVVSFLINSIPMTVLASNNGEIGYVRGTSLEGYHGWTKEDKIAFWVDNVLTTILSVGGIVINRSALTPDGIHDLIQQNAIAVGLAKDKDSYEDYVLSRIGVNEDETELIVDDELVDLTVEVVNSWKTEQDSDEVWREYESYTLNNDLFISDFSVNLFESPEAYTNFKTTLENLVASYDLVFVEAIGDKTTNKLTRCIFFPVDLSHYGLICRFNYNSFFYRMDLNTGFLYENHLTIKPSVNSTDIFDMAASAVWEAPFELVENSKGLYLYLTDNNPSKYYGNKYCLELRSNWSGGTGYYCFGRSMCLSSDGKVFKAWRSQEDYVAYLNNLRPYYTTSTWNTYNSADDNSTTLTQNQIDNSVTYNEVNNYVTNNYADSGSLSEKDLADILDKYLEEKTNTNSGSGDSGNSGSGGSMSDNNTGSGGGLGSFLEGLGSLGDALLSILGKVMDYLGQALELITSTITGIIEVIPANISNLVTAIFPFFPEEWTAIISLSLILSLILVILRYLGK